MYEGFKYNLCFRRKYWGMWEHMCTLPQRTQNLKASGCVPKPLYTSSSLEGKLRSTATNAAKRNRAKIGRSAVKYSYPKRLDKHGGLRSPLSSVHSWFWRSMQNVTQIKIITWVQEYQRGYAGETWYPANLKLSVSCNNSLLIVE